MNTWEQVFFGNHQVLMFSPGGSRDSVDYQRFSVSCSVDRASQLSCRGWALCDSREL